MLTPDDIMAGTMPSGRIQARMLGLGVVLETGTSLAAVGDGSATLECVFTGRLRDVEAATVVMATS